MLFSKRSESGGGLTLNGAKMVEETEGKASVI